jgi:hypothetical protein
MALLPDKDERWHYDVLDAQYETVIRLSAKINDGTNRMNGL